MRAPEFWTDTNWASTLLLPFSFLYAKEARRRAQNITPVTLPIPVICVGNLVVGGAGKTPVALALGTWLKAQMEGAFFLTKGYGGKRRGPLRVDPLAHRESEVGDEALLLAAHLPTVMAKDRLEGAHFAIASGAKLIVMDDGFQNPALTKNLSLLVVDGSFGFGNHRLLPAGPLREPVESGLARADAVVIAGDVTADFIKDIPAGKPILHAQLMPVGDNALLRDQKVLAFAGIGRPEKFYATLLKLGCHIVEMNAFSDHHRFTARELKRLRQKSETSGALLVTTEKDAVRLPEEFRASVHVVKIEMVFEEPALVESLLIPFLPS